jgi:hypothetical protein
MDELINGLNIKVDFTKFFDAFINTNCFGF